MSIKTSVKLKPFLVPNFVSVEAKPGRKGDGVQPLPTIPVADLDSEALDGLAQAWLTELYEKAGKSSPFCVVRAG